ncbi:MAG: response regulator, partial [Chthoniobacteraceae bacterium]|nr:response regulator [Chthoniobacteraceae bacterium]
TGYTPDEVLGRPWIEHFIPERNRPEISGILAELFGKEQHIHHENPILTKNGEKRLIAWNNTVLRDRFGKPEGTMSLGEDITERKQMEENLFRAQRMESIGLLAGGVAHDLNNILSPIMMSASMLHGEVPENVRAELIDNIEEAAFRGAGIVKQVLTFARGVKGERVILNPEALIGEVWGLVRETFPKSIDSTIVAPKGLWNIIGDQTQMCQVLLNLCVNARDAMPEGGKLLIDFANCEVDDHYLTLSADAKPGRYLRFEVTDTGTGIPPENIHRIFDPFFTTKELGVGTGLGLSTVMGIVRNHGGFVTAESQVGKGTTFRVFIPATQGIAEEQRTNRNTAPATGKGEVVLIVDDEADILKIAGMVLSRHGYRIKTAGNGADALACLAKHPGDIKLIITDLMMPTMDGARLIGLIRRFGFHVPVIAASGYGGEAYREELKNLGVNTILKKPFDAGALLTATHRALTQAALPPAPAQRG